MPKIARPTTELGQLPFFGELPASKWADRSPRESLTYFDYEPIIKKTDFFLEVEGDSMMPNIRPGYIVLVRHTCTSPQEKASVSSARCRHGREKDKPCTKRTRCNEFLTMRVRFGVYYYSNSLQQGVLMPLRQRVQLFCPG